MKKIIGIAPHSFTTQPDYDLIKAAGIDWLRASFRFPFVSQIGGALSEAFLENLASARRLRDQGFQLVGKVFGPGSSRYDPETQSMHWIWSLPAWAGTYELGHLSLRGAVFATKQSPMMQVEIACRCKAADR